MLIKNKNSRKRRIKAEKEKKIQSFRELLKKTNSKDILKQTKNQKPVS